MQLHWIWYAQLKGISNQRKRTILESFGSPEALFFAEKRDLEHVPGLSKEEIPLLLQKDLEKAAEIRALCSERGIGILVYTDSAYPARLRNIPDPPLVLYYMGMLPNMEILPTVGIVGTRGATPYAVNTAKVLGGQIAACGGIVVSGGAKGIDGAALEGAVQYRGRAIAVLAGGLDRWYPKENTPLFEKIVQGGCLLSEYPPGTASVKWNFLSRNRIISALSMAVLVVEAPARSGALNTAKWASEQGKDLFVVPGPVGNPACEGSNALMKDGARPVFSGWDVLECYAHLFSGRVKNLSGEIPLESQSFSVEHEPVKPAKPAACDKKPIDNGEKSTYSVLENELSALSDEERELVSLLTGEPISMDSVLARTQLPTAKAMTLLTKLVMKGYAQNHPGRRISLKVK